MRALLLVLMVLVAGCMEGESPGQDPAPKTTIKAPAAPPTTVALGTCDNMPEGEARDKCLYEFARSTKDRKSCNAIEYDNLKFRCLAAVEKDDRHCEKIDIYQEKDDCLWDMAFGKNDLSYCKAIYQQQVRDRCVFNFVSYKKANPMECLDLVNITLKDRCIFDHIGKTAPNGKPWIAPKLCYLIADPEMELECNQTYLGR